MKYPESHITCQVNIHTSSSSQPTAGENHLTCFWSMRGSWNTWENPHRVHRESFMHREPTVTWFYNTHNKITCVKIAHLFSFINVCTVELQKVPLMTWRDVNKHDVICSYFLVYASNFPRVKNTSQVIWRAQHANQLECENTSKLNCSSGAAKWFAEVCGCTQKHAALNERLFVNVDCCQ